MASAAANGYYGLDDRDLKIATLELLCEGGGGGGGTTQVYTGNGAPAIVPAATAAIYIQKDSVPAGILWLWYDAAWH